MPTKFNYTQIQGVKGNTFVTPDFIKGVEKMAERLETKPEYILAAMSFETGGTFNPSIQNPIGATGLIQFLKNTAIGLGTTTAELKNMTPVEQLEYVEKYFKPYKGKISSLEAVYTSILSGSPKNPDTVLFKAGTSEYKLNPLDWNEDGEITAREATTIVGARLFGGVKVVQKRLLDLGVVPLNLQEGFADGRWGKNTSKVLAEFQKSKGIAETGLMDEATGFALFPDDAKEPKTESLKRNDKGEAVERLQDSLVKLGYMETEKINSSGGYGKFGPQTQKAVETFQKDLRLTVTGEFGDIEQKALNDLKKGVAKGSSSTQIVRVIQDRLVQLAYMTQTQVNSGYGIFGTQTQTAVKKFQHDNLLQESGVVEAVTYKVLFNQVAAEETTGSDSFIAENGAHYTVATNILMTKSLQTKVEKVANIYFAKRATNLAVTSGYRPSERQAPAMYDKIINEGESTVRNLYKNKVAVDEILNAYRANKGNRQAAVDAIAQVIEKQVKRGVYISNHLLSNAIDVKSSTNLKALKEAVSQVGGRIVVEGNHYHIELH